MRVISSTREGRSTDEKEKQETKEIKKGESGAKTKTNLARGEKVRDERR